MQFDKPPHGLRLNYCGRMKVWRSAIFLILGSACAACATTRHNPAATCTGNGTCTDPSYPYCDVDGSVGGQPRTCIAVECRAGVFETCDDANTALVCNAMGEGYDPVSCPNGCDPTSGCVTCTANTQSCSSGVVTSCDATGTSSTTTCSLGCDATGNGCATPVPSNDLEAYLDMTPAPSDLDLEDGTLDLDQSMFASNVGGTTTTLPSFDVPAPSNGAPLRVFVVKHLTLGDITITSTTATAANSGGIGRAVAFLATDDIAVIGTVMVQTGALAISGCVGGNATVYTAGPHVVSGSGGGGNASAGAKGGNGGEQASEVSGGSGGLVQGSPALVPLGGGCPGGVKDSLQVYGGKGGGAIQLTSRMAVSVTGAIVVDGRGAQAGQGGGAGGGILIEAPMVSVAGSAKLLARGGGGAAGNGIPPSPPLDDNSPPGGTCALVDDHCADGGAGAPNPVAGGALGILGTADSAVYAAGSGGGGLGRIRVNTADGTFVPPPSAVLAGAVTNGAMLTD